MNAVVNGKCDRCHQFVKWRKTGRLTVDQKVKVVLFYAETKNVVATQRRFRAQRWAPCKQTIYRLSLGTIFQPMRINSVPDFKCFCSNKDVLCVQSMVWHFVRHLVNRCNRWTSQFLSYLCDILLTVNTATYTLFMWLWNKSHLIMCRNICGLKVNNA